MKSTSDFGPLRGPSRRSAWKRNTRERGNKRHPNCTYRMDDSVVGPSQRSDGHTHATRVLVDRYGYNKKITLHRASTTHGKVEMRNIRQAISTTLIHLVESRFVYEQRLSEVRISCEHILFRIMDPSFPRNVTIQRLCTIFTRFFFAENLFHFVKERAFVSFYIESSVNDVTVITRKAVDWHHSELDEVITEQFGRHATKTLR